MLLKSFPLGAAVLGCLLVAPGYGNRKDFQFKDIDLRLFDEVNSLDRHLEDRGFVYPDRELTAYVEAIAARLLRGGPAPERVQYHVRVLRDPTVQAFGFPNGSIYLDTGMLAVLHTEGQLATILGREIAHVADRHQYLRNRQVRKEAIIGSAAGLAAAPFIVYPYLIVQHSVAGRWICGNGYSGEMESEADRDGMALTTAAGYDPQSAARAFELLDEKMEIEPLATPYRSHDKLEARIKAMRSLAVSRPPASPDATSEGDYLSHVVNAVCYDIGADLQSRRARAAAARALRLVNWKPDRPEYRVWLADAYRELGAMGSAGTRDRRRFLRMTPEEEQAKLLAQPGGADMKKANEAAAEKLYWEAITQQPSLPAAHRGLGMLYQGQSRNDDAAREFRRYLELAPADALDRLRIERRLDELDKTRRRPSQEH